MIKWLLKVPPKIESKWVKRGEAYNPFRGHHVVVLAIKEGWVQYKWNSHSDIVSEASIRTFRTNYRELKNV